MDIIKLSEIKGKVNKMAILYFNFIDNLNKEHCLMFEKEKVTYSFAAHSKGNVLDTFVINLEQENLEDKQTIFNFYKEISAFTIKNIIVNYKKEDSVKEIFNLTDYGTYENSEISFGVNLTQDETKDESKNEIRILVKFF